MRLDSLASVVVGLREADIDFSVLPEMDVDTAFSVGILTELFAEHYPDEEIKIYLDEFNLVIIGIEIDSTNGVKFLEAMTFFEVLIEAKLSFIELFKVEPEIILLSTLAV